MKDPISKLISVLFERDDIIADPAVGANEETESSYVEAITILSLLKCNGYVKTFDYDSVDIKYESHGVLIIWSDKASDGNLGSKILGRLLNCFDHALIDEDKWYLSTKIYGGREK